MSALSIPTAEVASSTVTLEAIVEESKDLLDKAFAALQELEQEAYRTNRPRYGYDLARGEFEAVRDGLRELECSMASPANAQKLARALQRYLPLWLTKYLTKVAHSGAKAAYKSVPLDMLGNRFYKPLAKAVKAQSANTMHEKLAASAFMQSVKVVEPVRKLALPQKTPAQELRFPTATFESSMLNEGWKQLKEAWVAADKSSAQVEDRFRIEQIATAHLPESIRMFKSLSSASASAKREGEDLLLKQIWTMKNQLEQIAQKHSDDALIALRAQTAFIQNVAQNEGVLALPERAS